MSKIQTAHKRSLQKRLIARDGKFCHYCGKPLADSVGGYNEDGISLDHIMPQALGGSDSIDNLVLACRRCNLEKRTKHYQEYRLAIETDAAILLIMAVES